MFRIKCVHLQVILLHTNESELHINCVWSTLRYYVQYACSSVYRQVLTETQAIQRSPVSGGHDGGQDQRDA